MNPGRAIVGCGLLLILLGAAGAVRATITPPPKIYSLTQDAQDVHVKYGYDGSDYISMKMTLRRSTDSETKALFQDATQAEKDASKTQNGCNTWNCVGNAATECQTNPEHCKDCDSDGTPECCGECVVSYTWTWVDQCVVPGETRYIISSSEYPDAGAPASATLTVTEDNSNPLNHDQEQCQSELDQLLHGSDNSSDLRGGGCSAVPPSGRPIPWELLLGAIFSAAP